MLRFAVALLLFAGCARVPVIVPPQPKPDPDVVAPVPPVPAGQLWVLIVEETANRRTLPASQVRIFTSTKVQGWLRQNAPNHWRIWDKDVNPSKAPETLRGMFNLPRESLPWIFISDDVNSHSGPLPTSEAELLALLETFKP